MKKDKNTKRRLQLNKLTKQERAMKEAKKAFFAHPVDSARVLVAIDNTAVKASINKRLIAIILAIVMVLGLIPAGIFMLRPKAETPDLDAVDMIVRVNNDYYGTVSMPAGQIEDHIEGITETLSLPEGCTFERAIMEDTNHIPATVSTIAAVGSYKENKYYSLDANTNTGTLLENKQNLVLLYSNTYNVTTNATSGAIDCDNSLRHGNALHVTLTPDLDHSVSASDVTYTINGVDYHPTALNNNSFTISAAEITGDVTITVNFPAITAYTIRDAHNIANADSKYYNLYGAEGHGGITQGRGQSAVGNPSDNYRYVFKDYNRYLTNRTNEQRYNPKYLNRTLNSLDFSVDSNYPNLYETLGYTNISTNSNGVITDVGPNNVAPNNTAEFYIYSQSWSGGTSWILDSLSINGEYINFPSRTEIADENNKPSASTTMKKGNMAGAEVTVTLDAVGEGLYWKSLNSSGSYDPDVTYKTSSSSQRSYSYDGYGPERLYAWQLNSIAKKRTFYIITVTNVHDNLEVAYNFKDSSERTIVITDMEGIESAFASQEHRGYINFHSAYDRFYSVPVDSRGNLAFDAHNEYPAYYQERHGNVLRIPSNNLYLYQVKSGYNPYTVEATAKYYHTDGSEPTEISSKDETKHLMLAQGGGLPGDVIKLADQEGLEVVDENWDSDTQAFVSTLYKFDSALRFWGGSNSDGSDYDLVNHNEKSSHTDVPTQQHNIPLLLESIKNYEDAVKETKKNYKFYAIALLENEAMTQELKLKAHPYKYQVLFDLNGGSYNTVPSGFLATTNEGVYVRGSGETPTEYTLENGATFTRMPKGEQPTKDNCIFLGWQLYQNGQPVNDKKYTSNEVFAINEDTVWYADGDVTKDEGHTFTFKAVWLDKASSNEYAEVNIEAKRQTGPNSESYDTYYNESETQLVGDTVLLNLHDSQEELGAGQYDPKYYVLNTEESILATEISENGENKLIAAYDLALYDLDVTKKVIGSPKTRKEFPITVTLTRDEHSPISFATAKDLITPSIESVNRTEDASSESLAYTFDFKRSQNLTFADVPYGWTVAVSEPFADPKPNGQDGELDYTTTIASVPATAGSQIDVQDGDTATVWEGVVTENTSVTVTNRSESFLDLTKTLDYGVNGTYDLKLTAYANGAIAKEAEIVTEQVPTDYVLVVDQSTSMNTVDMPTAYSNSPDTGRWYISQEETESSPRYIRVGDDYYRVYRKRGYMYEYYEPDRFYTGDLIEGGHLSWFQRDTEEEKGADSEFFYNPSLDTSNFPIGDNSDNRFYPVKINVAGKVGYYAIHLTYTDKNNDTVYLRYPSDVIYHNPLNGRKYSSDDTGYDIVNAVVKGWSGNDNRTLTYGEVNILVTKIKTGMYVRQGMFRRHVGFNQLCYKDKEGKEHVLINATFCDANGTPIGGSCDANNNGQPSGGQLSTEQAYWNGSLHTATAWEARLDALQNSLVKFINNVATQEDSNGIIDHRIAIVGFSSSDSAYQNNEILTGVAVNTRSKPSGMYSNDNQAHDGPQYINAANGNSSISESDYKSALISAKTNKNDIIEAVDYITAYGGTQPEYGFYMAQNILEKRTVKTYQDSRGNEKDRNTVVIFFTDGQPGGDWDNQYAKANTVVDAAKKIKTSTDIRSDNKTGLTQIYSVGLFGEADGNPLTTTETIVGNQVQTTYSVGSNNNTYANQIKARDAGYQYAKEHASEYVSIEETYQNGFVKWLFRDNPATYWNSHWDYDWHGYSMFGNSYYYDVSGYAQYLYFYRKSLLGEPGYPAQQNDTIADYMSVVSSEYPNATSFDPTIGATETYVTATNRVRGSGIKQGALNRYYYNATSGDGLDEIFETIASAIPGTNTTITLDSSNAVLRDVINGDDFIIPENASKLTIKAWTEMCTVDKNASGEEIIPDPTSSEWTKVADIDDEYIHYDNGIIDVQGFDYATNFVGYDNENHQGQRIVVEIKGLVPKKDAVGKLESNVDTSGVYKLADSGDVLLDAFEVPNLYRYAYRLQEVGVTTEDKFDIEIEKNSAPNGILVPYDVNERSTSPLTFSDENTSVTWDNAKSGDAIFFESLDDDRVELKATVPSDDIDNQDLIDLTYQVFWENSDDYGLDTQFAMYKDNQTIEDSTILVRNVTNYRDVTVNLTAEDSPYVAPGYDFTVEVTLTGSDLTDQAKINALNAANNGTNVHFEPNGSKLKATITMPMKDDGTIDPVTFKVPDGVEVAVDHSDYFYTTDPYTYKDENFGENDSPIEYSPHEINVATTIYINDKVKDIIESGVMDETKGSHVILYILAGMAVVSGGAGAAYVYRKKDDFGETE